MHENDIVSGYLDVKISSKSRRGLTPWKAWQRQWCQIKRLDGINDGVELKFKSSAEGSVLSCVVLPRSSTICRTESRTKQHAFGIFTVGRNQKPLLFLAGASETNSQEWIASLRKALSVATYLPVGQSNFYVSLVDSAHSRATGLIGLYGILSTSTQEITISDPCTGEPIITWKWFHFHQFHLQAATHPLDDKTVCVMHTSKEFPTGPGQLYFYCAEAERLLKHLVARGKPVEAASTNLMSSKRLSRSEGDLCISSSYPADASMCFRSHSGSDDSGVRVSVGSDDSGCNLKGKMSVSLASLGMGILTKTPGGSETNCDSIPDLSSVASVPEMRCPIARPESGVSLASGVYEEISETVSVDKKPETHINHIYENPEDLVMKLNSSTDNKEDCDPPPLPRRNELLTNCGGQHSQRTYSLTPKVISKVLSPYKQRSSTLPARDLSRISHIFNADSEYVVMTPTKKQSKPSTEGVYMQMSPVSSLKAKFESYIAVNNNKKP